jgi:hypothetical protein
MGVPAYALCKASNVGPLIPSALAVVKVWLVKAYNAGAKVETALLAADAALVPIALVAVTVNV